jgi:hypothetical protein
MLPTQHSGDQFAVIGGNERSGPQRGRVAPAGSLDQFILACGALFQRDLPPLLDALFDKVDDALYDLADKAGSDRHYARYFDAMRLLRRQGRAVKTAFLQQLRRTGDLTAGGRVEPDSCSLDSIHLEDFALVEEAELEESLAIGNLVSKAESRYHQQLQDLGCYFGQLLGRRTLAVRSNPLGPMAICDAFAAALRPLSELELAIKLVIYKLFDNQVMDHLGALYDQCLALAPAQGLTLSQVQRSANPRSPQQGTPDATPALVPAASVPREMAGGSNAGVSFHQLCALLDQRREPQALAGTGGGTRVPVETSELMAILSQLQGALGHSYPGQFRPQEVRAQLESAVAGPLRRPDKPRRSLGALDEDTLDLVLLLFEAIAKGSDLPGQIKAQIGRLQIPYVKVAVLDKTFFDRTDHPARRLLNRLADAAIGWADDEPQTPDSLYGRIEHIADRIIGEFERDLTLFEQLDAEFAAYCGGELARVRIQEANVCASAAGKDGMAGARRKAQRAIAERLERAPGVPAVVESLLHEGWSEVLLAAYLSGGGGGKEWRTAVDVIDRLLWSIQPKVEDDERRALVRSVPELLRSLRVGLTGVGFDQRILARWFRELQPLHMAALRGRAGTGTSAADTRPASLSQVSPTKSADRGAAATPGGGRPDRPSDSASLLRRLAPGSWVELVRDDARRIRIKLLWVSADGDRFVFVHRRGEAGPELGRRDLETLLEFGLATILRSADDPPLVDRALAALAVTLNR